ncbi:MAG: hypothetical protein M3326_00150, partial [Actinomycetota bacterium]|nr:hypothetical protein [Actinomycetota bacterium]
MTRHPTQRSRDSLPAELRRAPVSPAVRAWVATETGATVVRARRLPGASTSAVHRLDLSDGASLVLRRYVWPGFLDEEPVAPRREVDALLLASGHQLAAPEVVAADITGDV